MLDFGQLFGLFIAIVSGLLGLIWVTRTPERVIASVCALSIVSLFLFTGIRVNLGSFNLEAGDALALALLVETIRIYHKGDYLQPPRWWRWPLMIFVGLYLLNIGRGFAEGISLQTIANSFRSTSLSIALLLYFTYATPSRISNRIFVHILLSTGVILGGVALLRYAGILPTIGDASYLNEEVARPITSSPTMLLACILVIYWFMRQADFRVRGGNGIALLLAMLVVVMQHRSVWLACITMVGFMLVFEKVGRQRIIGVVAGGICLLMLLLTVGSSTAVSRALVSSSDRAIEQEDTVQWRYKSWDAMLAPEFMGSEINYVIGRPAGQSLARKVNGRTVTVQGHNHYVNTIVYSGVIGLAAILALMIGLLRATFKGRSALHMWTVIIVGELAYWIAYGQSVELTMMIGIGYAFWRQSIPLRSFASNRTGMGGSHIYPQGHAVPRSV